MSVELYANGAATTISEDLDASESGVDVASTSGFPLTGNFRVLVGSEIMLVTGVSGSTFTVVRGYEGTTAATHTSGDAITHILTKDSMAAVHSLIHGSGFRTKLVDTDWTWINQGSATLDSTWGLSIYAPATSGDSLRILKKSAPATPYTITATINMFMIATNYSFAGIGFRQSSDGKLATIGFGYSGNWQIRSYKMASATSYSADYGTGTSVLPRGQLTFRIKDDGSSRYTYVSPDGRHFWQFHTVGRTDYLTADEVCFWVNAGNASYPVIGHLLSWEV